MILRCEVGEGSKTDEERLVVLIKSLFFIKLIYFKTCGNFRGKGVYFFICSEWLPRGNSRCQAGVISNKGNVNCSILY